MSPTYGIIPVVDREPIDKDMAEAVDEVLAAGDAYPPDLDDLFPNEGHDVPMPRAAQVRQRALRAQAAKGQPQQQVAKMRGGQRKLLAQENRRKALELRKAGSTFDQIAQAVGYKDASGARKAVKAAMNSITQEPAEELRMIQVERYNHMLLTLWGRVQTGDDRAIQTALGVMDRLNDLGNLRGQGGGVTVNVDARTQENAILVIDGNKDDYIAQMKRMSGIDANGVNVPDQQQITAHRQDGELPDMDPDHHDTIEGVVLPPDDGTVLADHLTQEQTDAIHAVMAPPKKTFNFGVDPTVRKK